MKNFQKKELDLADSIPVLNSNKHYRIGDLIFKKGLRWHLDRDKILRSPDYDNTFLKKYLLSVDNDESINKQTIAKLISKSKKNLNLDDETLYINMRIGDCVMEPFGEINSDRAYAHIHKLFIFYPDQLLAKIKERIQNFPEINKIKFIGAMHFGDNEKNNTWRFSQEAVDENKLRLNNIFNDISDIFNMQVLFNESTGIDLMDIDNDFISLCSAKHVVLDGASFGKLIKALRTFLASNE